MSTAAATLQTGVNAVTQERFSDAIEILEGLCNGQLRPPSEDYYQARIWLIRAYKESGQLPQAIKLCRQLATSSHPQVQQWAKRTLSDLRNPASVSSASAVTLSKPSFKPSNKRLASTRSATLQTKARSTNSSQRVLSPIEADKLLHCGIKALRRQKFPEAVKSLESFMRSVVATHPNINYAQISLAKAYMGNSQNDLALQLARKLLKSQNAGAQAWAKKFIETYDPRKSDRSLTTQADHDANPTAITHGADHRAISTPATKPPAKASSSAQRPSFFRYLFSPP